MFNKITPTAQAAILKIKIQEVDMSHDYDEKDKKIMMNFYKRKLKKIEPNSKF
jgi:hypothetical protein